MFRPARRTRKSGRCGAGAGHVTFGSFNNPAKITPRVVATWAEVLRRVPGSRLVLKYRGFGERRPPIL